MTALSELVSKTPAQRALEAATGWQALGLLIASLRGSAHYTRSALSERTGIEWPRLRRIEMGMVEPNILELESIAAVLGVPVQPLVDRATRIRRGEL